MSRETIAIRELANAWGCAWVDKDGKTHYGFEDAPLSPDARLWLAIAGGDAVRFLLEAKLGKVVATHPGAYGGTKRTVRVEVKDLEVACKTYWQQYPDTQKPDVCHYCGQPATGVGFFGEPVCPECGG